MGSCGQLANRRQARRFRAQHLAKIVLGPDSMISCRVEDISEGGARITLKRHMPLPDHFDLFIAAHDLQVHRARLCWRHQDSLGVCFLRPTDRQEQVHAALRLGVATPGSFLDEFERIRVEVERDDKRMPASMQRDTA